MVEPSSIALSELRSSPDAAEGAEQRNEAPAAGATVPADTPGAAEEFKTAELHAYLLGCFLGHLRLNGKGALFKRLLIVLTY